MSAAWTTPFRPPTPINTPEMTVLQVFSGHCRQLKDTGKVVTIAQNLLAEFDVDSLSLQESKYDNIFWLLMSGRRLDGLCFCCSCNCIISGSGGNVKRHASRHSCNSDVQTMEQKEQGFVLFMIRHNVGFTALRDPIIRVLFPGLTYARAQELCQAASDKVRRAITEEVRGISLCVMIDGWSDMSLRRYLGIGLSFFDDVTHRHVYRFLKLFGGKDGHGAEQQESAIRQTLAEMNISRAQVTALCSDSASVNTALAERMCLTWSLCCCHLWNLVFRHFLDHSPRRLYEIMSNINKLRKKTVWVEYLAEQGSSVRNICGFVPTRWCSACACINSFCQMGDFVRAFEEKEKSKIFSGEDFDVLDSVRPLLERFQEASSMIMNADNVDGLATVYEIVHAMYQVLNVRAERDWPFQDACRLAVREIEWRFFNIESRFCCRLLFAGVLNVAHSLGPFLQAHLGDILSVMASELELFTGSTPPLSPVESLDGDRYCDTKPLSEMIDGSPVSSEQNREALDEIPRFMAKRQSFQRTSFTAFWSRCSVFPHLKMLALQLRRLPTNTVRLEATFSLARRVLTWDRMRLTAENADRLCLLAANKDLTARVMSISPGSLDDSLDLADYDETEDFIPDDEE